MNETEVRRAEMFIRVREFGRTNAERFPASSLAGELFTAVGAVCDELERHFAEQAAGRSSAKATTSAKAAAREDLRADLEAISRTARAMALTTPGVDVRFSIPRNTRDQDLLGTARAFAAEAEPLKAEFVRHGLPADFLTDLRAAIARFDEAIAAKAQQGDRRVSATAAIDDAIERGTKAVLRLDAVVRNLFAGEPQGLAAWESARHVRRAARRTKSEAQTTAPAAPAAS